MLLLHSLLDLLPPPAFLAVFAVLYVVPSLVAIKKRPPEWQTVLVINIALGWTVFGWIIAFVMALAEHNEAASQRKD